MKALIIGATGFIGRELVKELADHGHTVVAVTRNAGMARAILGKKCSIVEWDGISVSSLVHYMAGCDAVVNLAGENIASGRWTEKRKEALVASRTTVGRKLAEAILRLTSPLPVLAQGSAIGIYGTDIETPSDESLAPGSGFLANLVVEWENSVAEALPNVKRLAWVRTGLVLGRDGGLLEKMLLPFRFHSGTVLGSGRQWMSWIHLSDEVRAIRFLLENNTSSGHYNLTAPMPVKMEEFIRALSRVTGKPAWVRVPGAVIKALMGEMAAETVLASQNALPARLLRDGFTFDYPRLEDALTNLLTNNE
ncbi:MAG: TIGR01777 family oxidoreductase [Bacteroidales bacterium]|nr:TIGR01777 family oxidoreductase [Bacteroidales bacterium]